jgi:SH3 domain protein
MQYRPQLLNPVSKGMLCVIALCFPLTLQAAKKGYVSDQLEVQVRSGASTQHKIIKLLPSGTPVTILSENEGAGYSLVKLDSGENGWILTRYLSEEPMARELLAEHDRKLESAVAENKQIKAELATLKAGKDEADKMVQQLNTELIAIRQASANALQIQAERDRLQGRVIDLERDLETTRREKSALDGDYRQNWFLIGASVLFGGMMLGILLPRLSWRKRSHWDSF